MGGEEFVQNYVMTGDLIALALCIVVGVLLHSTYTVKKTNLNIFQTVNRLVTAAAIGSLTYNALMKNLTQSNVVVMCVFRQIAFIALIWAYICVCVYFRNVIGMEAKRNKVFRVIVFGSGALFTILEIIEPLVDIGFYELFLLAYVYYSVVVVTMLIMYRKKLISKVIRCMWCVATLSYVVMIHQTVIQSSSYTVVTFTFPSIAVLFMFHYNSYDVETGTLDQYAFGEYLEDLKGKKFSMISLLLPEIQHENMRKLFVDFIRKNDTFFRESCCFRLRNNRVILVYQKEKNPDYNNTLNFLFDEFVRVNEDDKNEYKIVLTDNIDGIANNMQYIHFLEYIESQMQTNSVKICEEKDVEAFTRSQYIFEQVKDIYQGEDLDDSRVKVFCQPVLNTEKNSFSTAEALMRLELPELGLVYPDQFIPVLEKYNYIHQFSKIILHKTCKAIRDIEMQGYRLDRVSINFSVQELKMETFGEDIMSILEANGVSPDKIAIELTESRNEKDFINMKRVMNEMQEKGIKFYLDDFGTGYSNFERILGLPIDIIKFDRSLTILAGKSDETKYMVGSFSEIFKKADYQILFEGVEDEKDEAQCKDMNALYLQGYRYSKPIPIERLTEFLDKRVA